MQESYLAHYGVKGMKWGVRHDKYPLTPAGAAIKIYKNKKFKRDGQWTESGKARYTKSGKKKDPTKMSSKDLEKSTKRLHAENQYRRELREERSNQISNKIARTIIKSGAAYVGTRAAIQLTRSITNWRLSPSFEKRAAMISAFITGFNEWDINLSNLSKTLLPK